LLIEKLVHDNEVLMREVAELDAQLRQTMDAKDDAQRTNAELLQEKQERESVSQVSERLLHSMNAQVEMVRAEREEHSRQHAADKAYLREIFTALEAQLSVVRSEREELQSRADRERRASARRIKELEDSLAVAIATKERMREECGALRQPTSAKSPPSLLCSQLCAHLSTCVLAVFVRLCRSREGDPRQAF
jgi:predicted CopG family antitoxin